MTTTPGNTPKSRSALDELVRARYGAAAPELPATLAENDVLATLLGHRSVRAYRPDPLPPGTLELLVAAAQSAASSSNLQAFSVVAIEDPERKARVAKLCRDQKHILEAPLFLAWLADISRLRRVTQRVGTTSDALDHLETFLLAAIDAALAAENAVVAAESLGLGTVYIGALRNEPEKVAAELALPPGVFPVFGLVVGYPDPERPAEVKPRLSASAILHREQYDSGAEERAVSDYDEALSSFQASQKVPVLGWTQAVAKRIGSSDAIGARVFLAKAAEKLGFKLA